MIYFILWWLVGMLEYAQWTRYVPWELTNEHRFPVPSSGGLRETVVDVPSFPIFLFIVLFWPIFLIMRLISVFVEWVRNVEFPFHPLWWFFSQTSR